MTASPLLNSEADTNVIALPQRVPVEDEVFTTLNVRDLVPTTRLLLERLVAHHPSESVYDDLGAALIAARVASFRTQGKVMLPGSWGLLTDLYDEVATLVSDLTYIGERDVQHRYLGEDVGDYRWSADAALAVEQRINCDLDALAESWLGVS